MKIAFFEVEDWEKEYLENSFTGHVLKFYAGQLSTETIGEIKDTDILSIFIYSVVDKPTLQQLPALKLIVTRSTGFDHIDTGECVRRNISVANVPAYGENTVAEHTFALILSLSRNLYQACIKRLSGDLSERGLRGFDLKGKTLGVVGTGRIGLHVIRIAKGFGMKVLAFDVKPDSLLAEVLEFTYVPLDRLLGESDIITIHVPYNEHTHHLIDSNKFRQIKRAALLINTARGAVVDTDALIEALDNGTLTIIPI